MTPVPTRFAFVALASLTLLSCSSSEATRRAEVPPIDTARSTTAAPGGADTVERPQLPPWSFMSLASSGADTFLLRHPTYDGRGVVILIFDTGVDMGIAGLSRTSTGEAKVIDAVDVSGSNVIRFAPVVAKGGEKRSVQLSGGRTLNGVESLLPEPVDGRLFAGEMLESVYRNSSVRDFDGDGVAESRFGALLYRAADGWRFVLDTDADGTLEDETPVRSYRAAQETIVFRQKSGGKSPVTVAASIDTTAKEVVLHYDMGGHGTHVAGIAAGNGISGEKGFNGVAPGAQIISVKFSADTADDVTLTGGMERAYRYAARLADSLAKKRLPVVVNMSFGIGSAYEGRAEIERFIDSLLPEHPNLYVVTSAGNEGPGLSTVGIPAAANRVITVGAALPEAVGRDTYAAALGRTILWDFSSRGGEVDKPDVVAPGTAVSTIPNFAFQARESGTSMASPYTAGVVALLLSAMRQEDSTWMPTQGLIKRVLRSGAQPLPEYAPIEQGGGMVQVEESYRLLRQRRQSGFPPDLQEYVISTFSPSYPDNGGSAAYWRSAFVPSGEWRQTFSVNRAQWTMRGARDDFFRAYTLESTADWLRPLQNVVYIRNADRADIDVLYDREKLREPGLYSARILARRATSSGASADDLVEFELANTIIVPHLFSPEKEYRVTTEATSVDAGVSRRFYFGPPAGAAAIRFTLSVPDGARGSVSGKIAVQSGETTGYLPGVNSEDRSSASTIFPLDGSEGVLEVVVQGEAFGGSGAPSAFVLAAEAIMLSLDIDARARPTPTLEVTARATGARPLSGSFAYAITGYRRTLIDTMRSETWEMPIDLRPTDGAIWIETAFSPEDYMKSTDILVQLIDDEGMVQTQEALNTPSAWLFLPHFNRGEAKRLKLRVLFGAARQGKFSPVVLRITEKHVRPSDPVRLGGYGTGELYPYIPRIFRTSLPATFDTPAGYTTIGDVTFKPSGEDEEIAVEFEVE